MKKQVLFIQGGGAGAYAEDEALAVSLQEALGDGYGVIYPHMPEEDDPQYEPWAAQLAVEHGALGDGAILVGHSVGGTVLLRYLSEAKIDKSIAGIFAVAAPDWGAEEWQANLPAGVPVFLYHGRDDEIVPYEHLAQLAEKFPQATVRAVDGCGHQFEYGLAVVAQDIRGLEG